MYYTQEQIDRANQADLVSFLQSQGEQLTRAGNEYRWKRHDSLTVRGNKWYRHSQSKGGGPVDFLMEFFGKSFTEAVELLTGEKGAAPPPDSPAPLSDFRLPPRSPTAEQVKRYLTEARRIDEDVTGFFISSGDIYEDTAHHNAVFVGRDEDGVPRYAHQRSTAGSFRLDVKGSDKAFNFCYRGEGERLFVFEAPIDLLSFLCLSEEMFEKAQEILKRRAKPRRLGTDGKREKFSRKYAFSCMLECGFCGGTLTRRSWHSGSQYNKVIWQCVTATKKGKKFCPDSKGIAEETIEQAFIESYRLLCQNNKDVLDEFIARTEETLSDSNASKQLAKVEKDIAALDAKRAKLVDMRLEEIINKETYEQKYFDLSSQIEQLQKQRESLQESAETESTMKKRIAEFRRTLEENEVLDTFDRYVFESIVEKVIVGGYDEDGNKDPAMLTFIYKTGFKNSLDGTNFKPPRKNSKAAKQNAGLCSHTTDEAKSMCSYHSDDTYRGNRSIVAKIDLAP